MCLPTSWTHNRLHITSEEITDIVSLNSSTAETVLESFQDTQSISESDQTQVNLDPNRTIWDIPVQIQIRSNNEDLERLPEYSCALNKI